MAQSMLLEGDERDILGSLDVGQAVVKLQGRSPRPFMIVIPEFDIRKGMFTDAMVRERMRDIVEEYAVPVSRSVQEYPPALYPQASAPAQVVDPQVLAFLSDVQTYPESGVAARYRRLSVSVRQGQKLKDKLVERGLIQEHEKRTLIGRLRVIRLTEKGELVLSEHHLNADSADSSGDT
jgi:hypothetical protein